MGELLLGVAHGEGSVGARLGVGRDARARLGVQAAHGTEQAAHVLGLHVVGRHAAQAAHHAVADVLVGRGREGLGGLPFALGHGRALARLLGGLVGGHLHRLVRGDVAEVLDLLGEGREVLAGGDLAGLVEGDETKIVLLLEELIDDAAAPDLVHEVRVEHRRFLPGAGLAAAGVVAAVLGEEGGDAVVAEGLGALLVAALAEGGLAAPLVDVVAPEVDGGLGVGAAVEVGRQLVARVAVVVGRVADAQPAVDGLAAGDVGLAVAHGGLDKGRGRRVGVVVGHLVAGEEAEGVVEGGQGVDDARVARHEGRVPRRVVALDGDAGLTQVGNDVDAGVGQLRHALLVVLGRIHGVDADRVSAQLLQQRHVARAALGVGQRVREGGLAVGHGAPNTDALLVGDAAEVELCAIVEEEVFALFVALTRG